MRRNNILTAVMALHIWASASAQEDFSIDQIFPIETSHSYVSFTIIYMGYSKVQGSFGDFGGTIRFDEDHPERTSVTLRIGTESIDTNHDWRDGDLKSEGWFHVEKFPAITFVSSSARMDGDKLMLTGDLTLKDVTKEITMELAKPIGVVKDGRGDDQVIFFGSYTLNRRDYNVISSRWDKAKAELAALSEEVEIEFSILGKQIKQRNFSNWLRNPRSPQHHIYQAYNDSGMEAAFTQFELMKDTMDINSGALNIVGYMLLKEDKVEDAATVFNRNAEEFPEEANVYDSLGEALLRLDRREEAEELFRKALAMDPANTNAREILRHL